MGNYEENYKEAFKDEHEDEVAVWYKQQEKQMEAACYSLGVEGYRATSLFQFLLYIPFLPAQDVYDIAIRAGGTYKGRERYILDLINRRIEMIEDCPARQFADRMAEALNQPNFSRDVEYEISKEYQEGYHEYHERSHILSKKYEDMQVVLAKLHLQEGHDYRVIPAGKDLGYMGAIWKAMELLENGKKTKEE